MGAGENPFSVLGTTPRITSLLIKPASAVCNLDCAYCFYLDRDADPYKSLPARRMTTETLERLVDTYLFYSYPNSVFAFQGGEPTLAGLPFFEKLVKLQQQYGRDGQSVSNALQTNGILLDQGWCDLFKSYDWLLGVSLDGPENINDLYRYNKEGRGTWKRVMQSVELLQKNKVEFNVLCVLSQANVGRPKELYKFYRGLGIDNLQFIPLAEFDGCRQSPALHHHARAVRSLSVRDLRTVVARAAQGAHPQVRQHRRIAGRTEARATAPCTRPATATSWWSTTATCIPATSSSKARGSSATSTWIPGRKSRAGPGATASRRRRRSPTPSARSASIKSICHGGCPKFRHGPHGDFEELDYFCPAYKMIFAKSVEPLRAEVQKLMQNQRPAPAFR